VLFNVFFGPITERKREAYRALMVKLGATDLSDKTVEKYI